MINYLKEIIFLLGDNKKKVPMLLFIFIFVSLLDLIGVGLIYPFLSLVMDPNYIENENIKFLIGLFNLNLESDKLIIYFGIAMIFLFLAKSIVGVWLNWIILSFGQKQQIRLRTLLMRHYQKLEYKDYLNRNSSDFIYSIQTLAVQYSSGVIANLLKFLSEIIVIIALLSLLIYTSGPILILVILFFTSLIIGYDKVLGKRNQSYGKVSNNAAVRVGKGITEGMFGFKEIRLLNKEKYFYDMVKDNSIIYAENNLKQSVIASSPRYLIEFVTITLLVLFIVGPLSVGTNIDKIIPLLGVLGLAAMRLMPSMNIISGNLVKLRYSRDAVNRLYKEVSKVESNNEFSKTNHKIVKTEQFDKLTLDNISYKYTNTSNFIFSNLSLSIKKGETVGFIGESGSGKTTLIDIITGLLQPCGGELYYNEKKVNNINEVWNQQIAYIPQNIFLLDDTIKKNITLEENFDNSILEKALTESRLKELVNSLPNSINTTIGERGMQLSGGQRQRIALARALYHDREVLVMDEATSALDNETEKEIIQEIDSLKGKKTILIIAHRLSTLQNCDKIFKLSGGKIEVGTPKEIFKKDKK